MGEMCFFSEKSPLLCLLLICIVLFFSLARVCSPVRVPPNRRRSASPPTSPPHSPPSRRPGHGQSPGGKYTSSAAAFTHRME